MLVGRSVGWSVCPSVCVCLSVRHTFAFHTVLLLYYTCFKRVRRVCAFGRLGVHSVVDVCDTVHSDVCVESLVCYGYCVFYVYICGTIASARCYLLIIPHYK